MNLNVYRSGCVHHNVKVKKPHQWMLMWRISAIVFTLRRRGICLCPVGKTLWECSSFSVISMEMKCWNSMTLQKGQCLVTCNSFDFWLNTARKLGRQSFWSFCLLSCLVFVTADNWHWLAWHGHYFSAGVTDLWIRGDVIRPSHRKLHTAGSLCVAIYFMDTNVRNHFITCDHPLSNIKVFVQ